MNGKETRECQPYDPNACAVGALRKKGVPEWVRYVIGIAVLVACVIILTAIFRSQRMAELFESLASGDGSANNNILNGSNQIDNGDNNIEESEHSEMSSGTNEALENDTEESKNEESETLSDQESLIEITRTDMSYAEKGDGYVINYSGTQIDTEGLLEVGFQNAKYSYSERPVVLILHTHTSEGYYGFDKNNPIHTLTKSVVAVGERLAYELNSRGISTVHCSVIHDDKGNPYSNVQETIETMQRIYPTIEYVIDLHRLDLTDECGRPISVLSPVGIAQIRLTVSSDGQKPRDNLALALSIRQKLNSDDQRLCMPIVYTNSSYNSPMSKYYLKIDVGSLGNDATEALAAAEIFAESFADVLKK